MATGDEDFYKNDLQDYEKQNYWILGENLRISKGLDLGIRFFSNLTEIFLTALTRFSARLCRNISRNYLWRRSTARQLQAFQNLLAKWRNFSA